MKMLTCKKASHLISENQERPLGFLERWSLKLHLMRCEYCRRFEWQMALLRRALRELGRRAEADGEDVSEGIEFTPEARRRIRKAVAERVDREH
jgi:predicted anti-sigma-YlaC factor YlaD